MIFNSFTFPLASGGDFLGILIFIVVAILSTLSKRMQPHDETSPTSPTPSNETDLEEEMRRFLQESKQKKQSPPPTPKKIPPAIPARQFQPNQPVQTYKAPPKIKEQKRVITKTFSPTVQEQHEDILVHTSLSDFKETIQKIEESTIPFRTPQQPQTQTTSEPSGIDLSWLRSPSGLKQAFVISEILGQPRSLTSFRETSDRY